MGQARKQDARTGRRVGLVEHQDERVILTLPEVRADMDAGEALSLADELRAAVVAAIKVEHQRRMEALPA